MWQSQGKGRRIVSIANSQKMRTSVRWQIALKNKEEAMHVGIIGSKNYENTRRIRDILSSLKQKFGNELVVSSGGTQAGAEKFIKKYALEFNIQYREFNPAHTSHTLYSVMPEDYFNKPFHGSQHPHRYMLMGRYVDNLIILIQPGETVDVYKAAIDTVNKRKKKIVVMN